MSELSPILERDRTEGDADPPQSSPSMAYYHRTTSVDKVATIHLMSCAFAPPMRTDLPGFPTIEAARQDALPRLGVAFVKVCPLCLPDVY